MARILVTGSAGFIGFHLARRLLARGDEVVGLDNFCDYYDVALKEARLAELLPRAGFRFVRADVADQGAMDDVFAGEHFDAVVNLAAQVGVRHSVDHPRDFIDTNVRGFLNVLEGCRAGVGHLVYASSSSVYGASTELPYAVGGGTDHPLNLYAASKKANELMAHAYSSLHGIPTTGLRFFSVYGPWGRPDMAPFLFVRAILEGRPITLFNDGRMERDYTYVDDIVEGLVRVLDRPPGPDPAWSGARPHPGSSAAPYRVYNLGSHRPVSLLHLVRTLETCLGRRADVRMLPRHPGEALATCADGEGMARDFDFVPSTPVEEGMRRFVEWYLDFHAAPASTKPAMAADAA
ncbi:MAG TPA: NAD-dependent epimerase/dehydratase family protein [Longimicrobium sp.]|nr:NAD-dependent epimerase/dehydratase family protein [Longimicrobium sp.]